MQTTVTPCNIVADKLDEGIKSCLSQEMLLFGIRFKLNKLILSVGSRLFLWMKWTASAWSGIETKERFQGYYHTSSSWEFQNLGKICSVVLLALYRQIKSFHTLIPIICINNLIHNHVIRNYTWAFQVFCFPTQNVLYRKTLYLNSRFIRPI